MAATPLAETDRYIPAGVTRIYWVPAIADSASPTRLELDAGTDLTAEVAEAVGWRLQSERRNIQALGQQFRPELEGSLAVDDTRLLMYADQSGGDVATLLSRGDAGHVVILHGGDVAGNPMDVWPVRVAARARIVGGGSGPGVIDVQFVVSAEPALDVAVPS